MDVCTGMTHGPLMNCPSPSCASSPHCKAWSRVRHRCCRRHHHRCCHHRHHHHRCCRHHRHHHCCCAEAYMANFSVWCISHKFMNRAINEIMMTLNLNAPGGLCLKSAIGWEHAVCTNKVWPDARCAWTSCSLTCHLLLLLTCCGCNCVRLPHWRQGRNRKPRSRKRKSTPSKSTSCSLTSSSSSQMKSDLSSEVATVY